MDKRLERVKQVVKWMIFNGVAETQKDLALEMDYNPTVVSAVLTGHTKLTDKFIRNLCELDRSVDMEWVMGLKDEPDRPLGDTASDKRDHDIVPPGCAPYYSDLPVRGGRGEAALQDAMPSDYVHIPNVMADWYFPVMGYSMDPVITQGDMVGVRPVDSSERIYPDKVYMLVTADNERMIKHLRECADDPDSLELLSDNPSYPPTRIPKCDITAIFRVVFSGRRM